DSGPAWATRADRSSMAAHGDPHGHARELAARLAKAQRPMVLLGLGIDPANAGRIRRWIDAWQLPVAVTPKVKGIVDETSATFVGVISGMAADGLMCDALAASDCLVGFGLDPVEVAKTWHAELPIHWVLEAPNVGGLVPEGIELVDHAQLLDSLGASAPAIWNQPFDAVQRKRREMLLQPTRGAGETMWPGEIVQALASA